ATVQTNMSDRDGWALEQRISKICSKYGLDPDSSFAQLSGGQKRKVLLARAFISEPDLVLLDEPTNHLDITTIIWLENILVNSNCAMVIVSHDRSFVDATCSRIIELDRGAIHSYTGNYAAYLQQRAKASEEEQREQARFDKRLAQEEIWIRKGIQARRTRNEGRVRALKKMREERRQRREQSGTAKLNLNQAGKSGKLVVETKGLTYNLEGTALIRSFDCRIQRGDRVGIIGPNGCGKSTLIKLLTGDLSPTTGNIRLGTNLQIAYMDQHRSDIKDELSVQDNVSGQENITINGQQKHILGYLQDFLFTPARARAPAAKLSGGERNRLMLAKLFTRPFNLLILDEPTNDLDFETLELLEQMLLEYSGTLLLVSHDRAFLDNVVTSTIAFEGEGNVFEYIGGYSDWLTQRRQPEPSETETTQATKPKATKQKSSKLSYKLQRELDALPEKIEHLESQIETLSETMSQSDFYQQDQETITQHSQLLKSHETELALAYERWEELDNQ
ncbi:MAG: ATP-binding cassette domain-containing protein, partial [Pseudomonadota bacterium]